MNTPAVREGVVRDVMDRWKAALDAHEPERIATCFTQDAVFQGLHPYTVGREGIAEYYASQPPGLKAEYRILETRQVAEDAVLAYLGVDFSFTDRATLDVRLGVVLVRTPSGWAIGHYQVSRLD
ncbi:SgcJ/EcaC family oxidoreductase [Streptomyces sp. NPDC001380]|uniref:SgcJ/EcaC family oxidoreductase n=1 Tax=Streptomyces sp. NPDC001380 TaxID=3364566 RepID=UPI00367B1C4D